MTVKFRRILWTIILCSLLLDALCLSLSYRERDTPQLPSPGPTSDRVKEGPLLGLNEPEHDFGLLAQGVSVEHLFALHNEGTSALHIQSLEESCGCTSTLLSQNTLLAGEEGEIRVTFDSGSMEGPFRKNVTIHSNDDRSPNKITIKGSVQPTYVMDPARLLFGKVKVGHEYRRQVRITPRQVKTPLDVTRLWSRNPQIQFENLRPLKSGEGFAFEVLFRPTSMENPPDGVINLETGNPDIPRAWLRYSSWIEP